MNDVDKSAGSSGPKAKASPTFKVGDNARHRDSDHTGRVTVVSQDGKSVRIEGVANFVSVSGLELIA